MACAVALRQQHGDHIEHAGFAVLVEIRFQVAGILNQVFQQRDYKLDFCIMNASMGEKIKPRCLKIGFIMRKSELLL